MLFIAAALGLKPRQVALECERCWARALCGAATRHEIAAPCFVAQEKRVAQLCLAGVHLQNDALPLIYEQVRVAAAERHPEGVVTCFAPKQVAGKDAQVA